MVAAVAGVTATVTGVLLVVLVVVGVVTCGAQWVPDVPVVRGDRLPVRLACGGVGRAVVSMSGVRPAVRAGVEFVLVTVPRRFAHRSSSREVQTHTPLGYTSG